MVNENGIARKRSVTVGEKNDSRFEVVSGLNPDEQVLTEGNYDLKDGTAIAIAGDTK